MVIILYINYIGGELKGVDRYKIMCVKKKINIESVTAVISKEWDKFDPSDTIVVDLGVTSDNQLMVKCCPSDELLEGLYQDYVDGPDYPEGYALDYTDYTSNERTSMSQWYKLPWRITRLILTEFDCSELYD